MLAMQDWLHHMCLAIFVLSLVIAKKIDLKGMFTCLVLCSVSVGLYLFKFIFVYVIACLSRENLDVNVVLSGAVNRNFIAQYVAMFIPVFSCMAAQKIRACASLVYVFITTFLFFVLVSDVRGVLVSLPMVFFLARIFFDGGKYLLKQFSLSLLIAMIIFILVSYFQNIENQLSEDLFTSTGRVFHWINALRLWEGSPIFGVGPGGYSYLVDTPISHPHNIYLQVLSEWGAMGLSLMLILFVLSIKKVKLQYKKWDSLQVGVFLALVQGLLHAGVSGVLVMPLSQFVFCVLLGVYIGFVLDKDASCREEGKEMKKSEFSIRRIILPVPIVLLVASFFVVVYHNGTGIASSIDCIVKPGPRFWVDGGIMPGSCQ